MSKRSDRITANLPSRDFDATVDFYALLGFEVVFRNDGWMILGRGPLELEFFPHSHDPRQSAFSACVRVEDLDALYEAFAPVNLPTDTRSIPRLTSVGMQNGLRMFALIDNDGSLLRCIENPR